MTELEKARNIINQTDEEMAKLFEKRMEAVKIIAKYKKEQKLPIEDRNREDEVMKRNSAFIQSDDIRHYYIDFLDKTIELSKGFQLDLIDNKM
ncbi:MAG: chorismate mutase [Clostridia bacterium]|nr:chorismate mutase [Clostridia bacterium]